MSVSSLQAIAYLGAVGTIRAQEGSETCQHVLHELHLGQWIYLCPCGMRTGSSCRSTLTSSCALAQPMLSSRGSYRGTAWDASCPRYADNLAILAHAISCCRPVDIYITVMVICYIIALAAR